MNIGFRAGLVGSAVVLVLAGCGGGGEQAAQAPAAAGAEEKVLNVYNWSDYIAEDTIANFTAKTGIKVNYDVFDSNEVLETKLLAGNTGYDVVVPSAQFMERQIKAGVFQKLDKSKLPNLSNMDPEISQRVALHDPGNEYSVNYFWGTDGIGYNEAKVKAIMPDAPVDSWNLMFDPKVLSKFKDCGVSILDAPAEVRSLVLAYLGKDPNSQDAADLALVEKKLLEIRPYIRKINSSQYIEDLANGEICIALGWSGDVLQARDRAAEAKQGTLVKFSIPKEGTIIWFDMLTIPSDAKHVDNAHQFINYMMDAQVAANNSNTVNYANGNAASFQFVKDEVKNDPSVYPTTEVKAKLFPELATNEEYTRLLTRTWTRFSTGQ
ncbi:MAG: polyamine ABC transporter substrate-binding protein [Steroidobacteraceae bacterium]